MEEENFAPSTAMGKNQYGFELCQLYEPEKDEWVVEKILAMNKFSIRLSPHKFRTCTKYLVLWKGFPVDEATWEPEKNMRNCQEKINEFLAKKNHEAQKRKNLEPF